MLALVLATLKVTNVKIQVALAHVILRKVRSLIFVDEHVLGNIKKQKVYIAKNGVISD